MVLRAEFNFVDYSPALAVSYITSVHKSHVSMLVCIWTYSPHPHCMKMYVETLSSPVYIHMMTIKMKILLKLPSFLLFLLPCFLIVILPNFLESYYFLIIASSTIVWICGLFRLTFLIIFFFFLLMVLLGWGLALISAYSSHLRHL